MIKTCGNCVFKRDSKLGPVCALHWITGGINITDPACESWMKDKENKNMCKKGSVKQ